MHELSLIMESRSTLSLWCQGFLAMPYLAGSAGSSVQGLQHTGWVAAARTGDVNVSRAGI